MNLQDGTICLVDAARGSCVSGQCVVPVGCGNSLLQVHLCYVRYIYCVYIIFAVLPRLAKSANASLDFLANIATIAY